MMLLRSLNSTHSPTLLKAKSALVRNIQVVVDWGGTGIRNWVVPGGRTPIWRHSLGGSGASP